VNKSGSASYFQLAADQRYADAPFNYGIQLFNGNGIATNKLASPSYFKLAADQGLIKA
jgi:TPR repeat protein